MIQEEHVLFFNQNLFFVSPLWSKCLEKRHSVSFPAEEFRGLSKLLAIHGATLVPVKNIKGSHDRSKFLRCPFLETNQNLMRFPINFS